MREIQLRWMKWSVRQAPVELGVRTAMMYPILTVMLTGTILLCVGIGAVAIDPLQIVAILMRGLGISLDITYTPQQEAVLWSIRLPRVILGMLVGGALAVAGATLQGIFRNPLADPGLIGVSSGAALGAVAAIVFNFSLFGMASLPVAAFAGGLLVVMIVYVSARRGKKTEIVTLLLTGIALNAIAGAGTGLLTFLADDQQLRSIVFWSLGSLGGATWQAIVGVLPFIICGVLLIPRWGRALNLFVLGESEAGHLGVETERVRLILIVLLTLITGASVAVCGIIGFVGLVVPHILRLLVGPDHRLLLPGSTLAGAILLPLADLAARMLVVPAELPLGVVTSLVGGPFFLWLLFRTRRQQGGWG